MRHNNRNGCRRRVHVCRCPRHILITLTWRTVTKRAVQIAWALQITQHVIIGRAQQPRCPAALASQKGGFPRPSCCHWHEWRGQAP